MNNLHFALICLIHGQDGFKTVTLKKGANYESLFSIYKYNLQRTLSILDYCLEHNIKAYRVSSALFPLMDHSDYVSMAEDILASETIHTLLTHIGQKSIEYNISLTTHPDQFCLLSSLRDEVNQSSLQYLERQAKLAHLMNIQAINIHGGAKTNGEDEHYRIFHDVLSQASTEVRNLLTLENDEKSYNLETILNWCEKENLSCTYDAHHERCFAWKSQMSTLNADLAVQPYFYRILETWKNKPFLVTHISSPRGGWLSESFRELCSHHDVIDASDIPSLWWTYLTSTDKKCIIDVEAKHKQEAVFPIREIWYNS